MFNICAVSWLSDILLYGTTVKSIPKLDYPGFQGQSVMKTRDRKFCENESLDFSPNILRQTAGEAPQSDVHNKLAMVYSKQ